MSTTSSHRFSLEFLVRDYECDLQGIVNNANYLHYLEHTRHQFLLSEGIDFAALSAAGINLVVLRVEIDYLRSLRSGDRFIVTADLEPVSTLRMAFVQHVYRLPDWEPIVRARTIGTGVNERGRPVLVEAVRRLIWDGEDFRA